MFHPDFLTWTHLEWLRFQSLPMVVYLVDTRSLEGAVIPAIASTGLLLKYRRQAKDWQIILGFLLFTMIVGIVTEYWGRTGLHLFPAALIIWPVLALLLGNRFPWPMAYPMAFVGTLIPDLYGAGMAAHWTNTWFFGVGGAGFQDDLFLVPEKTFIAAALLHYVGIVMRRHGYFSSSAR